MYRRIKKLLIIYPNWYPSNAVGVLRVRLIANYLLEFGWQPIIVAVHPDYYEEEKSDDLVRLVADHVQVHFVPAKNAGRMRLYGDIALRAFGNLKRKAIQIIQSEKIDCMWVPIPPFYTALIARQVHDATRVPYVIDYIDPWVHDFPGSHRLFSRAKLASLVANFLEPVAVKKAAGFTGVSAAYYLPVLERNKHLKGIPHKGMPYGFDPNDYKVAPSSAHLLWNDEAGVIPFIYAGAFLPNAHYFIDCLFQCIAGLRADGLLNTAFRFYFVGTGKTNLSSILDYARQYGIADIVIENQGRIPYLEVLHHLSNAAGILAIGSTEQHYTASKIFQALLSGRPVFPVFHHESTVVDILKETASECYLVKYFPEEDKTIFEARLMAEFISFLKNEKHWQPQLKSLDKYSAKASAVDVVSVLNKAISEA